MKLGDTINLEPYGGLGSIFIDTKEFGFIDWAKHCGYKESDALMVVGGWGLDCPIGLYDSWLVWRDAWHSCSSYGHRRAS